MCRFLTKYTLFSVNFIFVLIGLALIALGVAAIFKLHDLIQEVVTNAGITDIDVNQLSYPFIVVGVVIFLIAFFGCCGAITESKCLLITYAVFLSILTALKIALMVTIFVKLPDLRTEVEKSVDEAFLESETNNDNTVHALEALLKCCGTTGPDYYNNIYNLTSPTCCENPTEETRCQKQDAYQIGCTLIVADGIEGVMLIIAYVLIGIIVFEMVIILFTIYIITASSSSFRSKQSKDVQKWPQDLPQSLANINPDISNRSVIVINLDGKREEIKIT